MEPRPGIRLRARDGESALRTDDILGIIDREAGSIALRAKLASLGANVNDIAPDGTTYQAILDKMKLSLTAATP